MKFVRKNWAQMLLIAICVLGFVFSVVLLARSGDLSDTRFALPFGVISQWIGFAIFFFGVGVYLTLRLLKVNAYISHGTLVMTGLLVTIFMIVATVNVSANWTDLFGDYQNIPNVCVLVVFPIVIQMLVLGLFPLVIGTRRLLNYHHVNHAGKN